MRTRTKVKKDASASNSKKTDQVFRLTDMIVEEVSAVDRAANKRTFLLVKSADGAAAAGEVVESASGELTVSKAPEPPTLPAASTTPPESQAAPASPEVPPVPTDTNPENAPNGTVLRLSQETKDELVKRATAAAQLLSKLNAQITSAEVVQGLAEVPQEVIEGVAAIVSALDGGVTKAAVEKGRKQISMARETKIREAHKALGDIVAELDAPAANAEPEPEVPAAPAPAAAAPAAPAAPAAKTVDKRDQVIAGLVATVEKAATSLSKQAARIDALERARPTSNAGVVEATPVKVAKTSDDVSWPMDMNSGTRDGAQADGDFTSR